ncbi:hydroxymethylpyrimidine/phosphomethylpyrimidine kinase [Anaerocolumna cellulosilytica]|uniref:Hydroxymethylpyrimidine/phosphomethylpyrimidine kinase n=1 Tax=Anaerocolumna cellulosilytica TaxID=433286 RepID=A0A6S6QVM2_9FIRM|nr:bifunctional hydroxymethylpyrimidine kinase/phosphomethylpyrimidine kinase [Anaerocolumna cellulosilytica]MBB5197995.1 hydroxymethylpyrimidine/phosphomethylpyrimidine kinase [Anaerocolumna cellulosilytica]BCJ93119.1 hydroxymethylpyrimidine/phosphomethylpyrimidine kinase [Anaerocolumna cellulosilytica]
MKHVLTIAGSDCSGGAGIQADLKTFSALGTYGMSVITSVVAENTSRVISIHDLPPSVLSDQLDAVFEDIQVDAVKVGMLSDVTIMETVVHKLTFYKPPFIVIDPVMSAKGGQALMKSDALTALIDKIVPLAYILTPNIPEAETMTGLSITTVEDMKIAANRIYSMGSKYVLLKGGHLKGAALDLLYDGNSYTTYSSERILTKNTHGTGCTFSSAITACLAKGLPVEKAIDKAKEYITGAIRHALPIGKGHGPTNHFFSFYR